MLVYVFHYQDTRFPWYKSSLAPRWCRSLRAPQRLRVALRWCKGFAGRHHSVYYDKYLVLTSARLER